MFTSFPWKLVGVLNNKGRMVGSQVLTPAKGCVNTIANVYCLFFLQMLFNFQGNKI